jgi:RimJ/RimL family protein N-acetyltransferase
MTTEGPVLSREVPGPSAAVQAAGPPPVPALPAPWGLRLLLPEPDDVALLVGWMAAPHVSQFWQQDWPAERWARVLAAQHAGDFSRPCLVLRAGRPFGYLELYRTARDVVSRQYPAGPHDLGVHLAIGDLASTGRGLGRELLRAVVAALLHADPACARVLVEPDVRNQAARKMFAAAGFRLLQESDLGHKRAALMVCEPVPAE